MDINTKTDFERTQAKYQALVEECRAEDANLDAMNANREHSYQMAKAEAYQELGNGRNTKIVMSGSSGDSLIQKIFDL